MPTTAVHIVANEHETWTVHIATLRASYPMATVSTREQAQAEHDHLVALTDDERSALIIASLVD